MHLLRAAGLITHTPSPEFEEGKDDEALGILVEEAEKFLRCGVSMPVYQMLSDAEKSALILAHDKIMADLAVRIGYACQGPSQAAEVAAPIDGGRASDSISLAAKVAAAAQTYNGARVPPVRA